MALSDAISAILVEREKLDAALAALGYEGGGGKTAKKKAGRKGKRVVSQATRDKIARATKERHARNRAIKEAAAAKRKAAAKKAAAE